MRRGQAELIGGLVILTLVLVILVPFLLQIMVDYSRMLEEQGRASISQAERLAEKIIVSWLSPLDPLYPAFWVNNTGTVKVTLKTIYITDVVLNRLLYTVNLSEYKPDPGKPITSITKYPQGIQVEKTPLTLNPGESALIKVNEEIIENYRRIGVSLLSERGIIHPVQGRGASIEDIILKAIAIEQKIVAMGDILNSPHVQLRDPGVLDNSNPTGGVKGYKGYLRQGTGTREDEFVKWGEYGYSLCNTCYVLGRTIQFSNAIIGLNPRSGDKLNIFLTYVENGVNYRVKIEGFKPQPGFGFRYRSSDGYYNIYVDHTNYTKALGFWYYGRKVASEAWIRLSGYVGDGGSVKVYRQSSGVVSSYDPYIFVADTDGNGVAEFIFTTEDYGYGDYNPPRVQCFPDESGDGRTGLYLDYSVVRIGDSYKPDREWGFAFMLRNIAVDPSIFSGVMVVLKIYFHDTEGGDFDCVDQAQLPILRVMLVKSDWTVADSKTFLYWELAPHEDTWHPNEGRTTLTLSLFIPPHVRESVYLAIAVVDPYGSGGRNDLDYTLAIELVGISTYGK